MIGDCRALSVESVRVLSVESAAAVRVLRVSARHLRMSGQCRGQSVGTVRAVSAERMFERENENVMYLHIFRCNFLAASVKPGSLAGRESTGIRWRK